MIVNVKYFANTALRFSRVCTSTPVFHRTPKLGQCFKPKDSLSVHLQLSKFNY